MNKKISLQQKNSRGAASIFVVIFTMLIISTIVVGFTGIMLRDQSQASDVDLSKSAYDSALAGVEDAKRAVSKYMSSCGEGGTASTSDCVSMKNAFINCNSNNVILYGSSSNAERVITTKSGSTKQTELNQAYTCVKTTLNTSNYVGSDLQDGQQAFIPLKSAGAFNKIKISWFSRENVNRELTGSNRDKVSVKPPVTDNLSRELPHNTTTNWPTNKPPVLRAQYIQVPASYKLTDFDETSTDGAQSNTNSIFMYPTSGTVANTGALVDLAPRFDNTANPWQVSCDSTITGAGYACRATLDVPPTLGGAQASSAYLMLRPFYNLTDYEVQLYNGSTVVDFDGAQPQVDSTGRANDIFRRVAARIEPLGGGNMMPVGAVDVSGNFCKTFSVTDNRDDYSAGACDPNEGF